MSDHCILYIVKLFYFSLCEISNTLSRIDGIYIFWTWN